MIHPQAVQFITARLHIHIPVFPKTVPASSDICEESSSPPGAISYSDWSAHPGLRKYFWVPEGAVNGDYRPDLEANSVMISPLINKWLSTLISL
jgi:hypothetical protein